MSLSSPSALFGIFATFLFYSTAAAAEPTLPETVKYLDEKLTAARVDDLELQGAELKGSILTHFYRAYDPVTLEETPFRDEAISIDLKRVKDFDTASRTEFMKDGRGGIGLRCDASDNLCAARKTCFNGSKDRCTGWEKVSDFDLPVQLLSALERERVRKTIIHLKSFFPFQKRIELFDKN